MSCCGGSQSDTRCVECLQIQRKHPGKTLDELGLYSREVYIYDGKSLCMDHVPVEKLPGV